VPSKRFRVVPSSQFRVPFAVGGTIKELMLLDCRYVAATLDLLAPFPAGRSGLDSGRSYLGSLVPRRQVRSGVALCQAGLVGRSIRWQCDASGESSFLLRSVC